MPSLKERWAPNHVAPDAIPMAGFCSQHPAFEGVSFQAYAQRANRFRDHGFDIVMVDGRARTACMEQALPKVRPGGGILILDNAERPRYEHGRELLDGAAAIEPKAAGVAGQLVPKHAAVHGG